MEGIPSTRLAMAIVSVSLMTMLGAVSEARSSSESHSNLTIVTGKVLKVEG